MDSAGARRTREKGSRLASVEDFVLSPPQGGSFLMVSGARQKKRPLQWASLFASFTGGSHMFRKKAFSIELVRLFFCTQLTTTQARTGSG